MDDDGSHSNLTPWVLFTVFVLGPCEPLIPLPMAPAARHHLLGIIRVTSVIGLVTLLIMIGAVRLLMLGIGRFPLRYMERYAHALAGGANKTCGVAMARGL